MKHIEEIENYYEGNLSDKAKVEFDRQLESSVELREELELYRTMRNGLKELSNEKKLQKELKQADKELDNRKSLIKWLFPLGIAACVLGIIGIIWINYYSKNSYEILVEKYSISDPGLPVFMSEKSDILMGNAIQLYQDKKYKDAMKILGELKQNDTTTYYLGLCIFNLKQDAVKEFAEVFNNKQSAFGNKAGYYEALCFLRVKRTKDAKFILNNLSKDEKHPFIKTIRKLLQEPLLSE